MQRKTGLPVESMGVIMNLLKRLVKRHKKNRQGYQLIFMALLIINITIIVFPLDGYLGALLAWKGMSVIQRLIQFFMYCLIGAYCLFMTVSAVLFLIYVCRDLMKKDFTAAKGAFLTSKGYIDISINLMIATMLVLFILNKKFITELIAYVYLTDNFLIYIYTILALVQILYTAKDLFVGFFQREQNSEQGES